MTIGELIAELQQYPPECIACLYTVEADLESWGEYVGMMSDIDPAEVYLVHPPKEGGYFTHKKEGAELNLPSFKERLGTYVKIDIHKRFKE